MTITPKSDRVHRIRFTSFAAFEYWAKMYGLSIVSAPLKSRWIICRKGQDKYYCKYGVSYFDGAYI